MHVGRISLCDTVAYNVKSDDDKRRILDDLDRTYSVRVIRRHHETFDERRHVPCIRTHPYFISVRTNGNPYYLYLTRINLVNQCILIDKKVQQGYFYPRMIVSRFCFADELFENTLFEGEMVRDKNGGWTFLVNDLLALRDRTQAQVNLSRRLNTIYGILATSFVPDACDICRLSVKRYFPCSMLMHVLQDFVPRLPYTCRGVYFKPLFFKYRDVLLNFDDSLVKRIVRMKYKDVGSFFLMSDRDKLSAALPSHVDKSAAAVTPLAPDLLSAPEPSASRSVAPDGNGNGVSQGGRLLWVRRTNLPDVYELYEYEKASPPFIGIESVGHASVPRLACSRMLREIFKTATVTDAVPMWCTFTSKFGKWTPETVLSTTPLPPRAQ